MGKVKDGKRSRSTGRQGGLNMVETSVQQNGGDICETRFASCVHVGDESSSRMAAAGQILWLTKEKANPPCATRFCAE